MGSDIPGQVVLGNIIKHAEQTWEQASKQHSPWSLGQLLPPDSCRACVPALSLSMMDCDLDVLAK